MFTRRISAIVGTLLALLTLVGTSTAAHAAETTDPTAEITDPTAETPGNLCDILPICPRYR